MSLKWYWHRLRAMEPSEVGAHLRKKLFQLADTWRLPDWSVELPETGGRFPQLPCPGTSEGRVTRVPFFSDAEVQGRNARQNVGEFSPQSAPSVLREALGRDAKKILTGEWKAFGHLQMQVDQPPRWQKDYFAAKDLSTDKIAFKLNHRDLPEGADVKLIWEFSRWYQLVRLAQAGYVLGDANAARMCLCWLEDWIKNNPPYRGWNWTSALESGMRLVQLTWMDALLSGAQVKVAERSARDEILKRLCSEILPPHIWFTWRYRSFGSSANNHLLGELAGLILAIVRWPVLARWAAPLDVLQPIWEREVLAQFAEDGGNREQALNYHLFSWEFCWQTRAALTQAGRKVAGEVDQRLKRAVQFFLDVQVKNEPWDYGDSDNAFVTPLFAEESNVVREWQEWMTGTTAGSSLNYWLGELPQFFRPNGERTHVTQASPWRFYEKTGIAVSSSADWHLRWDLSPLGYLATAAHGHLDALHLSIWHKGLAFVIDPGTGAYYADKKLRSWLASRAAHNGPAPVEWEGIMRLGPFLWSDHHQAPRFVFERMDLAAAEWNVSGYSIQRKILSLNNGAGWQVLDECRKENEPQDFTVRWQFAPGSRVEQSGERKFVVHREGVSLSVEVGKEWEKVQLVKTEGDGSSPGEATEVLDGIVSPAFRKSVRAPLLKLFARNSGKSCLFSTTFLA